jgi:hypothetical protein
VLVSGDLSCCVARDVGTTWLAFSLLEETTKIDSVNAATCTARGRTVLGTASECAYASQLRGADQKTGASVVFKKNSRNAAKRAQQLGGSNQEPDSEN